MHMSVTWKVLLGVVARCRVLCSALSCLPFLILLNAYPGSKLVLGRRMLKVVVAFIHMLVHGFSAR